MDGSMVDIGPAVLFIGLGFLAFGLLAWAADSVARHKLRAEIDDARAWLRLCSTTAVLRGTSADYSDLYEAYSTLQQLRWELGQL